MKEIEAQCRKIFEDERKLHIRKYPDWKLGHGLAYIRCRDDDNLFSFKQQIKVIFNQAINQSEKDRCHYFIHDYYLDLNCSANDLNRSGLELLKKRIQSTTKSCLFVTDFTRLYRNSSDRRSFTQFCQSNGCTIRIPGYPLDLNDPSTLFMLDMMTAIGEYESEVTAARIRGSVHATLAAIE